MFLSLLYTFRIFFIILIKFFLLLNFLSLANKYYPSSKKCNRCGEIKKELTLKDRIYKCNKCGLEIDRDINAAINLANYIS